MGKTLYKSRLWWAAGFAAAIARRRKALGANGRLTPTSAKSVTYLSFEMSEPFLNPGGGGNFTCETGLVEPLR